ncbi:MAG: DUF4440 domain-containing protein [Cognatishimia sp.]|uniref:YybH family protein n=1 Tax=Cognatishimia sp. TaxID=2211648 RepID=UPI003B8BDE9E
MKHAAAWLMALALSTTSTFAGESKLNAEQTNVLNLIESMTTAFEAKDIDAVMTTYEPSATIMFEPGVETSDFVAIKGAFKEFAAVNPEFSYSGHEVIVQGDIALHISPWSMTGTLPDGQEIAGGGLSVAVARRQEDGSWKMVIDNPYGGRLLDQ